MYGTAPWLAPLDHGGLPLCCGLGGSLCFVLARSRVIGLSSNVVTWSNVVDVASISFGGSVKSTAFRYVPLHFLLCPSKCNIVASRALLDLKAATTKDQGAGDINQLSEIVSFLVGAFSSPWEFSTAHVCFI